MFFSWFRNEPKPPPVPRRWIGQVSASFRGHDPDFLWVFYYQLFEDENGRRSYEITGRLPPVELGYDKHSNTPTAHMRYSAAIAPFLAGADLGLLWPYIEGYDADYWNSRGYFKDPVANDSVCIPLDKNKNNDFKLLEFPKLVVKDEKEKGD